MKYHLNLDGNVDSLSSREFRSALARSGVDMKVYEVNQILAYTSPSTSPTLPVKKFIEILKGHVMGFSKTWVERLWGRMEERVRGQGELLGICVYVYYVTVMVWS
ncbi:hypothetical protein EON65_46395 [archaeon]|nr:MAG: hypothetical protein EON65_46395 [archaeon]